jgi:hypothetical protein
MPARKQIKKGEVFADGNLIAVEDGVYSKDSAGRSRQHVLVRCTLNKCGKKKKFVSTDLRGGKVQSCGCMKNKPAHNRKRIKKGDKLANGNLIAVEDGFWKNSGRTQMVRCLCTLCGNEREKPYDIGSINKGKSTSCGCHRKKITSERSRKPIQKGRKFRRGKLIAVEDGRYVGHEQRVRCKCMWCGETVKDYSVKEIRTPKGTKSCGCIKSDVLSAKAFKQVKAGERFYDLQAIEDGYIPVRGNGGQVVKCVCLRCNKAEPRLYEVGNLKCGNSQSCGCRQKEWASKHGVETLVNSSRGGLRWKYEGPKGEVVMRSSYEVAVAHALDKDKTKWTYEPKQFLLADGVRYIPDFYLPSTDEWIEVKGYASESWLKKEKLFRSAGYKLIVVDNDSIKSFTGYGPNQTKVVYAHCRLR